MWRRKNALTGTKRLKWDKRDKTGQKSHNTTLLGLEKLSFYLPQISQPQSAAQKTEKCHLKKFNFVINHAVGRDS